MTDENGISNWVESEGERYANEHRETDGPMTDMEAKARELPRTPEGKLQLPNVITGVDREWLRFCMAIRAEAHREIHCLRSEQAPQSQPHLSLRGV